jgi:hypothetical protein
MTMVKAIRPRAEHLRQLPTLAVETPEQGTEDVRESAKELGIDFRLELKLVTDHYKYWLCTQGAESLEHGPDSWIVGYVTMECLEPDEEGEYGCYAYGPDNVNWLQGLDYYHALTAESERLQEQYKKDPTDELERKIESTREEIDAVLRQMGP